MVVNLLKIVWDLLPLLGRDFSAGVDWSGIDQLGYAKEYHAYSVEINH